MTQDMIIWPEGTTFFDWGVDARDRVHNYGVSIPNTPILILRVHTLDPHTSDHIFEKLWRLYQSHLEFIKKWVSFQGKGYY